jgi:apolipoprotein N-acyltransferase
MRALEMARPLVSVTNSGATALIDEKGIVQKRLPTDQEGVLDVTVTAVKGEPTPYVKLGDWPALLLALAMFVAAGLICLFKKRSQKG